MVLEYLPTWLGHKYVINVGQYSSTMEHLDYCSYMCLYFPTCHM